MSNGLFDKGKALFVKHKEALLYLFFGGVTTVVNFVVFFLCNDLIKLEKNLANFIAWFVAVLVAYITNKLFVFESKSLEPGLLLMEAGKFYAARIATGVMEFGLFFLGATLMGINEYVVKIFNMVLVIVSNYFLSKLLIFRKKNDESNEK